MRMVSVGPRGVLQGEWGGRTAGWSAEGAGSLGPVRWQQGGARTERLGQQQQRWRRPGQQQLRICTRRSLSLLSLLLPPSPLLGDAQVRGVVGGSEDEEVGHTQRPRHMHKVLQLVALALLQRRRRVGGHELRGGAGGKAAVGRSGCGGQAGRHLPAFTDGHLCCNCHSTAWVHQPGI